MGGLGDNPQGVLHRRNVYAGTPFEKNYQLVNKDQLEVRVYGNTLFAGWPSSGLPGPPCPGS
jgi:hypothetical protein